MNLNIDKKQMVYIGIGIFALLVILNSTKKVPLKEVTDLSENKSFDSSSLPVFLRPPKKLEDGEPLPQTAAPKYNISGMYKRFDQ